MSLILTQWGHGEGVLHLDTVRHIKVAFQLDPPLDVAGYIKGLLHLDDALDVASLQAQRIWVCRVNARRVNAR